MTNAEQVAATANMGEDRERSQWDEIVIDDVSIPIRSAQRTDTSRFEGKVTFGDYTIDSDQLMSTWAQTSWVGGGMIDHHQEGATDSRFRYARAWTMSPSQMTLPLYAQRKNQQSTRPDRVEDDWNASQTPVVGHTLPGSGVGLPHTPWITPPQKSVPLGARFGIAYFANGATIQCINLKDYSLQYIAGMYYSAANTGAWFPGPDASLDSVALWIPLGEGGLECYNPVDDDLGGNPVSSLYPNIKAVAVKEFGNRLYVLTAEGQLLHLDRTNTWHGDSVPTRKLPDDEAPRHLVSFFDRSGNPAIAIVTDKQVWIFQEDSDTILPLGLQYPMSPYAGQAAAVWRDDGLYVSRGLGINRMSTAGVRTGMGLDRDDGYQVSIAAEDEPTAFWPVDPTIWALAATENFLVAAVNSYRMDTDPSPFGDKETRQEIMAYNEAGWHHIATLTSTRNDGNFGMVPSVIGIGDSRDGGYKIVVGEQALEIPDTIAVPNVHVIDIPDDFHSPRASVLEQVERFDKSGVFYSGWFDAGMANFYKAWSQLEIYLADPHDGNAAPPGEVRAYYRTDQDLDWAYLGTADAYGRTVLPFGVDDDNFSRGLMSLKIEYKLEIEHSGSTPPFPDSPVIEGIVLKFQKLAQYGSAWQFHVPLSDWDNNRNLGPREIDAFLGALSAEGGSEGPFAKMIHGYDDDGNPREYRIRVSQWQRAEATGANPMGDGILSVIAVPIAEIEEVDV